MRVVVERDVDLDLAADLRVEAAGGGGGGGGGRRDAKAISTCRWYATTRVDSCGVEGVEECFLDMMIGEWGLFASSSGRNMGKGKVLRI